VEWHIGSADISLKRSFISGFGSTNGRIEKFLANAKKAFFGYFLRLWSKSNNYSV
jgi:hypothetical protein